MSWLVQELVTRQYSNECKHTANSDSEEHKSGLFDGESIHSLKDKRERSEEAEEYREIERNIEGEESYDRFGEEHVNWSEECDRKEDLELLAGRLEWCRWRWKTALLVAMAENSGFMGFFREESENHRKDGEEDYGPLSPAPGLANSNKRTQNRSKFMSVRYTH